MKLINADELVKVIENENSGLSISGAVEKFARITQVKMQPAIEAIPIEWIKKWKWQEDNDSYNRLTIDSLIRDWEKENERV